jgi:Uma2 family endonuclease
MTEKLILQEMFDDPAEGETIIAEGVTFENFLKYFGEKHTEWLVGKVIQVVTNNTQHNEILSFLVYLLKLFLTFKPIGRLLLAGIPMKVGADRPAREPDLLFVLNENAARIKTNYLDGPADLVVEIVSPESVDRDRAKKLLEYEAAGVKEYWLIDPLRTEWVIYALGDGGHYHPRPSDSEGRLTSAVLPGFALQPAMLWQETLPNSPDLIEMARQMANGVNG